MLARTKFEHSPDPASCNLPAFALKRAKEKKVEIMNFVSGGGAVVSSSLNQDVTTLMEKFRRGRGYGPYSNVEVKVEMLSPSIAAVTFSRPPLKPSYFASPYDGNGRKVSSSNTSASVTEGNVSEIVTTFEVKVGVTSMSSCTWNVIEARGSSKNAVSTANTGGNVSSRGRVALLHSRIVHDLLLQRHLHEERLVALERLAMPQPGTSTSRKLLMASTLPAAGVHTSRFVDDVCQMLELWGSLELDPASIMLAPLPSSSSSSSSPSMPANRYQDNSSSVQGVSSSVPLLSTTAPVIVAGNIEGRMKRRCAGAIFLPSGLVVLPPLKAPTVSPRTLPNDIRSPLGGDQQPARTRGPSHFSSASATMLPLDVTPASPPIVRSRGGDEAPLASLVCGGSVAGSSGLGGVLPKVFVGRVVLCGVCPVNALVANGELAHQVSTKSGGVNGPVIAPLFHSLAACLEGAIRDAGRSYLKTVLAPTLVNVVWAMLQRREPFWAGVCVCCVLLPGILGTKRDWLDLGLLPMQLASVVDVVTFVFRLYGDPVRSLEAATVSEALEMAHRRGLLSTSSSSPSIGGDFSPSSGASASGPSGAVQALSRNSSFSLFHKPISCCVICSQALQRTTRAKLRGGTFPQLDSEDLPDEGSLIVQCLSCGHGGHVNCIQQWQAQRRGCAVGTCGCECRYV